jgi:hypothetical protein
MPDNNDGNWDIGIGIISDTIRGWLHGPTISGADLATLRSGLTYAEHSMAAAARLAEFRRMPGATQYLQRARQAIGTVSQGLDGIQVFREIDTVRRAIQDLNRIGNVANDPNAAARAFGQLCSGLGQLSSHLPPPANTYADFLSESGEFFTNMLSNLDPAQRWRHREDGAAVDLSRPMRF